MKKIAFILPLLLLAGCRREPAIAPTPSGTKPEQMPTPVARPGMARRVELIFPRAKVTKLNVSQKGEYFVATRNGKLAGRVAMIPVQDSAFKKLQILIAVAPDGKIKSIAAGVPGTAGLTPPAAALNEFLSQFEGKNEVSLAKFQLRRGVKQPSAKRVVDDVKKALILLKNASKTPVK